jgi:branched-chain amino acid transport system ATP-binding protein
MEHQHNVEAASAGWILDVRGVSAGYSKRQVLFDVSLHVKSGEMVTLLGHNGAGKTTLLRVLSGMVDPTAGLVSFNGRPMQHHGTDYRVRQGMSLTLTETPVFRDLTVRDNLELGGFVANNRSKRNQRLDWVLEMFPALGTRTQQRAGTLSGGEQRMLALGVALMADPKLILLDEPSLGLAPVLVQRFLSQTKELVIKNGLSILLVEQNVPAALRVSDRAYFMRSGRLILEESAEVALARGSWWDLF